VKDRVRNDIGAKKLPLEEWSSINWKAIKKKVRNLRQRIYRATQNGQWNKVRNLMKLMIRSYSNLLLSVRKITQENAGRETAGIDGQTALTPTERVKLVKSFRKYTLWKVRPTKRVYIPKANGKKRPLGIPTIRDRVAQSVVKNALEPSWEARFEENSYGFRPGRGCHDAISQCHSRLCKGNDTWVLDADIKGAFDNISHEFILNSIGLVPGRELIKQWLKAGYVEAEIFHHTDRGTPQGGTISPLLANIALDGMEKVLSQYTKTKTYKSLHKKGKYKGQERTSKVKSGKYGFIRYADDFVVTSQAKEDIEAIIPILEEWLMERGLELNKEKTNIVHIEQGFNFLGFNIRQFNGSCFSFPQKEKIKSFLRNIRQWLKINHNAKPEAIIKHLNPILTGWGNYYKCGASKRIFSYVDHKLWKILYKWCLRKHPNKGKKWVVKKYFKTLRGRKWNFATEINDPRRANNIIALKWLADIPIERHIKVKGSSSPDDPILNKYWQDRKTRYGKTYWDKGSKLYKVAENQAWKCTECGEHLFNGEKLHTHHIESIKDGGSNLEENLTHLHQACHSGLHSKLPKA
jgi:RNA-directed DNA polymerase